MVGNTWQMELEIKRLLRESPADARRHLDQDRVRRFAKVLDQLPPVTVFALEDQSLLLVDGYHRLAAAQQAGRTTVRAEVRVGTKTEALQFAVDLAQAEVSVSADQARDAIRRYSGRQNKKAARATDSTAPNGRLTARFSSATFRHAAARSRRP
jgi:ParB-like chromosome segregation protein Spo0J